MDELAIREEYKNQFISVANTVIRAREHTNLLESKIEALAIHHMDSDIRQKEKKDAEGNSYKINYVMLSAAEIRKLMNRTDGDTYADIRKASIAMKQELLILEDKENKSYILKNMYGDIAYSNGLLYVEIEPSMEKYFKCLKDNFTKLKLPILFSFKTNGGFQLYKILKSYAYPPYLTAFDKNVAQDGQQTISVTNSVADWRMLLGYVDIKQNALEETGKRNPNWDKIIKADKGAMYQRWQDFNTRVIKPGIEEINAISDIFVKDVITETSGRGGKVSRVTFVVQHNAAYYNNAPETNAEETADPVRTVLTDDDRDDFVDSVKAVIHEDIKTKDIRAIASAADYDLEKVKAAYKIAETAAGIENLTGFLIKAIKDGYDGNHIHKANVNGNGKKSNSFNNFNQRDYDFDELERTMLAKKSAAN